MRQLSLLLLALLSACAAPPPPVDAQVIAKAAGTSVADLTAGRELFMERCDRCHKLRLLDAYTAADWPTWLDKMQQRASIDDAQKKLILHYILAARGWKKPEPSP